jgi:hypothetical protein
MDQYSPTHFKQFSDVLQNAKQRESYTGHGTNMKDVAYGFCALHMWLNITGLQPAINSDLNLLPNTTVICS